MVKCTIPDESTKEEELEPQVLIDEGPLEIDDNSWVIYVHSLSNSLGSGAGLILTSLEGTVIEYALCFEFPITNNKTEYEALAVRLWIAKKLGI